MEKPTPHRKLPVVKALVETGKVRATSSAKLGATALGLELPDMLAVMMALTPADFFQEHDHPGRSHGMAGRLPPKHAGGRCVPETDGH